MSRARNLVNRSSAPAKWFSLFGVIFLPVLVASGDITKNLVAHYALDDKTGTTARDSSDGKHDGTLEGYYSDSAGWTTGKIDGALSFDGTDDYVSVPHHNDFDLKTYTLAAWVSVSSGSEVRPILVKGKFDDGVNATDVPFALYLSGSQKLTLAYEKSASSQRYAENMSYEATGEGLTEGEIYHVAVTRNNSGGLIAFYVDGQSRGSFESTPKPGDNNKKLYLGLDPKTNKLFKGGLDDVRIYSRALEASEIQDLYALGANSSQNDSASGKGSRKTNDSGNETENGEESESSSRNDSGKEEDSGKTNDSGSETTDGEESESSSRNDSEKDEYSGKTNGKAEEEDGDSKKPESGTDTSKGGKSTNTNESSKAGAEENEGTNYNDSGQQTVPSNENPETNDSSGDDKDSEDDSKETEEPGNRSGDSDDFSSQSGKASGDRNDVEQSGSSSRTDEDKASSEENEKESDPETGKGGDDLSNQTPRNLTLTKNSIYEGRGAGSIVGKFQVVDDDDPNREGSYLIELISNNSAGRRVGRSTSSNGEEDSSRKSEEVGEDNKNDQRAGETDDKGDEKTAGQSSESSSRKDDEEKSGGTQDSGKNDGSATQANESESQSNLTDDDKETSANSSNGSRKESSSGKDSGEENGGSWFTIDEEGRLAITQVLDYETRSSYSIRVRATDKGGLSVEKDFVIQVKNAFAPIVRTVGVANRKAHRVTVSGKILANGHSTISEVGGVISKQPRFKLGDNGTESIQANNVSQQFDLLVKGLEPETTYYFRIYAINGEGLSYSALERFTTTKSDNGPWSKTDSVGNGWLHSEWLGHVYPTENNWVYHAELGWLYAKQNDSDGVWLYSKDFLGWFWTGSKVYPFVYSDRSKSWVYYQGIVAQHRVFFHFGQNSWMAVASDGLTKQRESGKASSKNSSVRQNEEGKSSGSVKEKVDAKSSETTAGQKR